MTFFVCPLCGKCTSLNHFDPSSFDHDIYVQEMRGLGRGRGFEPYRRISALDDPSIVNPIKERILELAKMLYDNDLLSDDDISEHFGLVSAGNLQSMISDIEETLEEDSDEWEVEIEEDDDQDAITYKTLCFGLDRLIESHEALEADAEEEEEED